MRNERQYQNKDRRDFLFDNQDWQNRPDRKNRDPKKWNSDVRMAGILLLAVLLGGGVFFATQGDFWPDWTAKQNDNVNLGENNQEDSLDYNVLNPVPVRDSQQSQTGQNSSNQDGDKITPDNSAFLMPVDGVVTKTHSPDTPVYSKTLDQYMVHVGIDIDTTMNTPVRAVKEGTVIKVYDDDKYGSSVWISHPNGIVSKYGNLSKEKKVGEGDVVKTGDIIGTIGDTALLESLDISHLHFAMEQDGKAVDPLHYLAQ